MRSAQLNDDLGLSGDGLPAADTPDKLTLDVGAFAWVALAEESAQLGVSIEELASFSVLYYVADRGSGRIARRFPQARPGDERDDGRDSSRVLRIERLATSMSTG